MTDRSQYPSYYFDPPAQPVSAPAAAKVDPTFAWVLACVPLLGFAVFYVAPNLPTAVTVVGFCLVNGFLAELDGKQLKKAEVDLYWAWAAFLAPVYLILRTVRAKSTPAIPVVWCAAFVASIVAMVAFGPVTIDTGWVESQVASDLDQQFNTTVDVSCPANVSVRVHESFTCGAYDHGSGARAHVLVTVTSHDGMFRWRLTR